jgi:lactate dehydrogenase-like 2-hydroxyacid dehydrogenase
MRHRVLVAAALTDAALEVARARFDILYEPTAATEPGQMPSLAAAHNAVAVVLGSRTKVPASEIERLPKAVKMVATVSVGFDHIDLAAARAAGLIVTNTPDVLTNATADITLFLMLGALRRGKEYAQIMTDGWRRSFGLTEMLGLDANGRTLGIVGMGRIGQAVAHRARAFGMTISYHNRNRLPPQQEGDAEAAHRLVPPAQRPQHRAEVEVVIRSGNQRELLAALHAHEVDLVLSNQAARRDALLLPTASGNPPANHKRINSSRSQA